MARKTPASPTIADTQARYRAAVDAFVTRAKADPYILGVVLCGSLAYDSVWEKSDIDLVVIDKDSSKGPGFKVATARSFALVEDGINIHASMHTRSEFRRAADGSVRNSFVHSLLAHGRLVYARDPSLPELFEDLGRVGAHDRQAQLLGAGSGVVPLLYKAQKWLAVRGDLDYAFMWILAAANALAKVEVIAAGEVAGREVIRQAMALNPEFFGSIYTDLIAGKKTRPRLEAALDAIDGYLSKRVRTLFGPILEFLLEAGAPRSASEIESHFANNAGVAETVTACEWLADKDVIRKVSAPVRLTPKSPVAFEELAFYYDGSDA